MVKTKTTKEIPFSEARQKLSAIIDEVQRPSRAVSILRYGKPAAVIISHDEFEMLHRLANKKKFKLAGSLKFRKGVDVDEAIAQHRKVFREALEARAERLRKELNEP